MSNMDRVIAVHGKLFYYLLLPKVTLHWLSEADSDLVCQPGARWMDLNEILKEKGIVYHIYLASPLIA